MLKKILKIVLASGVIVASLLALNSITSPSPTLALTQQIAGSTYTIAGGGMAPSDTSFTLQSFTLTQTGQPIQTGNLSSIFYMTLEPGNKTKQEIVGCTAVTQETNGTALISGCSRGLSPIPPYTASTTLAFSHAGGSQVIISDAPQIFNQYPAKDNNETVSGLYVFSGGYVDTASSTFTGQLNANGTTYLSTIASSTFSGPAQFFSTTTIPYSTASSSAASVGYVNGVAVSGAPNANQTTKGIVQEASVAQINAGTAAGSTGAELYVNPAQFQYSTFASSTVVVSQIPKPLLPITTVASPSFVGSTTLFLEEVNIPQSTTVNSMTLFANGGTTSGTSNIALFSENGQTRYLSTTTATITQNGIPFQTYFPGVSIPAGNYWLVFQPVNTLNWQFRTYTLNGDLNTSVPNGHPLAGTLTATASTMPSAITISSISTSTVQALEFRIDN